jgi:signal transduction histidine kinase
VVLAGAAVALGLGAAVARVTVRPVAELTGAAERVTATGELHHRIGSDGDDELARLAASFNTMLTALERSRDAQRQLVADASHELRTPLTSIRANLELLERARRRSGARARGDGGGARAQLEELDRPRRRSHRPRARPALSSSSIPRSCASTSWSPTRWSALAGTPVPACHSASKPSRA